MATLRKLKPGRTGEMLLQRQKELQGIGFVETREQEEIAVPVIPFDWFEKQGKISLTDGETRERVFEIKLNEALTFHKVYACLREGLSTPGAIFFILGELVFLRSGARVGYLPLSIARDTAGNTLSKSAWNACCVTTVPSAESMQLTMGGQSAGTDSSEIFVAPAYLEAQADEAIYNVVGVGAQPGVDVEHVRIAIGIRSTKSR